MSEATEEAKDIRTRVAKNFPASTSGEARNPARRATDFPTNSTAISAKNRPGEAVIHQRTGKSWRDWFSILNAAGFDREQQKKAIAANTDANASWRNLVLIAYELECGMREQYVRPEGYDISVSRTVNVPVAKLFRYWSEEEFRNPWLGVRKITLSAATLNQSIHIAWEDGITELSVEFSSLDEEKTRVVVKHRKLPPRKVQEMRAFWTNALKALKAATEAGL